MHLFVVLADVRSASGGRGPTLTQRLLLRLLLSGHSAEEFAGGHADAASSAAAPSGATAPADTAEPGERCSCAASENGDISPSVLCHLESCTASGALLEGLLCAGEAGGQELAQDVAQLWGGRRRPMASELTSLLHRLSANVHSITNSEIPEGYTGPSAGSCACCDAGREVAVGLYGQPLCRFNHSCSPNAVVVFGGPGGPLEMSVVASRSIAAGEEICICYISPAGTRAERRNKLNVSYAFQCTCVLCCSCPSTSSSRSHANGNPCIGEEAPESFALAEAFDLQLRGTFCVSPECIGKRTTPEGDVLQLLEDTQQRLLERTLRQEGAPRGGSQAVVIELVDEKETKATKDPVFRGIELAARGLKMKLPVLYGKVAMGTNWEPVLLFAADAADKSIQVVRHQSTLTQPQMTRFGLTPEELLASQEVTSVDTAVHIRCCACGTAYKPGDIATLFSQMGQLQRCVQGLIQVCCSENRDEIRRIGKEVLGLFSAVRRYLHPSNLVLQAIMEKISSSISGVVCLYKGIGLAVAQRLVLSAASLHGRCSPQHGEQLITEGRMLLFLSQADTRAEAREAWALWSAGDSAAVAVLPPPVAHAAEEAETATRAKLAYQARECFLQACSIFFSLEGCDNERAKGRLAEQGVVDCDRELQALGCGS